MQASAEKGVKRKNLENGQKNQSGEAFWGGNGVGPRVFTKIRGGLNLPSTRREGPKGNSNVLEPGPGQRQEAGGFHQEKCRDRLQRAPKKN